MLIIVTKGENMEEKRLTPIKAIRAKCLDCCCGSSNEVKLCTCTQCALYPYRLGHKPANMGSRPLAAIRAKCKECSCYGAKEPQSTIANCSFLDCPLYRFRSGHNPALKGKRNNGNSQGLINYISNKADVKKR